MPLEKMAPEICTLEDLTKSDADEAFRQIEAIEKKSFPKHECLAKFIRQEATGRARTLFIARYARRDDAPLVVVGYLLVERSAIVAHINKLCVAESARRRGIGRALVAEAAQRAHAPVRGRTSAASRPLNTMTLHVDPMREAAFGLYTSMGFRETSRRIDYYCKGRDAAFMELDMTEHQPWNARTATTSPSDASACAAGEPATVDAGMVGLQAMHIT